MSSPQQDKRSDLIMAAYQAAFAVALVAGILAAAVAAVMATKLAGTQQYRASDSPEITASRQQVHSQPSDAQLRQRYCDLDLKARREYFLRMRQARLGGYLLAALGGLCISAAVAAGTLAWKVRPAGPMPEVRAEKRTAGRRARLAVGGFAVALMAVGIVAALCYQDVFTSLPTGRQQSREVGASEPAYPSAEEVTANWPRFRGPGGRGVSAYANAPTTWDGRTGQGVLWRSSIPLPGQNSPIVWSNRVFLTGADRAKREVFCYDADTGSLLWRREVRNVPGGPSEVPAVSEEAGLAAPTAATDGRRVYAIFANGDLAAFSFDGGGVWTRNLGLPKSMYGYASSLAVYYDRVAKPGTSGLGAPLVLVQYDQGYEEDGLSELLAIGGATGRTVWRARRPVASSWATPVVADTPGGPQVITCATPWVMAHDPSDGKEIWRVKCLDGEVAPSPIYAGGLVFAVTPDVSVSAIRPDGRGDVTSTHIAWQADEGAPDIASPASDGKTLLLLATQGLLTCYDAASGRKLYEHQFDGLFRSSPTFAGDRVYLMDEKGVTYVIAAGESFNLLATAEVGEKSNCSPAFADGRIYIRGEENLYCIANKPD